MTPYQVTLNAPTLHRLFSGDVHLASLLESLLNQVIEAQVREQLRAARYKRTDERQGYRNKPRQITTRGHPDVARAPGARRPVLD